MTNHDAVTTMSLPPPTTHSLIDVDRVVGWTSGRTIGFTGFADEHEAAGAAWLAHHTIERRLAPRGRLPIPRDGQSLELARLADADEVLVEGAPIARILHPGVGSLAGADWYAFELRVPHPADEVRVRALAYLAYRSLRRSGIPWAIWDRPAEEPLPSEAARVVEPGPESEEVVEMPRMPTHSRTPVRVAELLLLTMVVTFLVVMIGFAIGSMPHALAIAAGFGISASLLLALRWGLRNGTAADRLPSPAHA